MRLPAEEGIMSESVLLNMVLTTYVNEPCRICGRIITRDDIDSGAVFAGYSKDGGSRGAHKRCWDGMVTVARAFYDKYGVQVYGQP